jgi:hypothetical protein
MNEAQNRFGFEVVDISIPLGAWQHIKGEGLQLNANIAARGLNNKRQELGVDFLFCIIDKLITYEEDDTVYTGYNCWWSGAGQENIIIFAAAYENQPTQGSGADHLVGNAMVQGLAGILADTGTHERGSKHCPLYWNGQRDMGLDIGSQRFDKTCEKGLKKKIPKDLPALKVLLSVFD